MTKRLRPIALLLPLLCAPPAVADYLRLENGRRVEGILEGREDGRISIRTAGGLLSLPLEQVAEIGEESPARNLLHRADFAMRRGRLAEARALLDRAGEAGLDRPARRAWLSRHLDRLRQELGQAPQAAREDWQQTFFDLAGVDAPPAQELIAQGRDDPATLTLAPLPADAPATRSLGPAPDAEGRFLVEAALLWDALDRADSAGRLAAALPADALPALMRDEPRLRTILLEGLREHIRRGELPRAARLVEKLEAAGQAEAARAHRILLLLRMAGIERERGRIETALSLLDERLEPLSPALARQRMAALLVEEADALRQAGRHGEAEALLLEWGERAYLRGWRERRAENLRAWAEQLLVDGKPGEARRKFLDYYELRPGADKRGLDRCDFRERLLALGPHDYADAFELGLWAAEKGLPHQALEALRLAEAHEPLTALAREQIDALEGRIAARHFAQCLALFEQGDPDAALQALGEFPLVPRRQSLQEEIERLRKLCYSEIKRRNQLEPVQAEILFQNAQREYFMAEDLEAREAALLDMKRILYQYPGTPVIPRVSEFLRQARGQVELERLSGSAPAATLPAEAPDPAAAERELLRLLRQIESDD